MLVKSGTSGEHDSRKFIRALFTRLINCQDSENVAKYYILDNSDITRSFWEKTDCNFLFTTTNKKYVTKDERHRKCPLT